MILKYVSLIFLLLFSGCGSASSSSKTPPPTQLLIPLYSLPTDTQNGIGNIWDKAANSATKIPVCIIFGVIRGDNEPVGTPSQEYIDGLKKLRDGGAKILAYVETTNAKREIDAIKKDIKAYAQNFDIDGIFFDEVNGKVKFLDYYNEITNYAKSFKKVNEVMLNSSGLERDYIVDSDADSFLVYENSYEYWNEFDSKKYAGIDLTRLHVILHSVDNTQSMKKLVTEVNRQNITNLYITDNEFDLLPTFFDDEVSIIQENNALLK